MSLRNKPVIRKSGVPRQICIDHWQNFFASEPPRRIGGALLEAMITQARQESKVASMYRVLEKQLTSLRATSPSAETWKQTLRVGDRIIRGWGGINHEVTILPKGFSYRGEIYKSLSEIARHITGARWSGPRFFATRKKQA